MRPRLQSLATASLLACLVIAGPARAALTLTPAQPTTADAIHIVADEGFSGGLCWSVASRTCTTAAPDSIILTAYIQFCRGGNSCFCTAQPVSFQVVCDFAPLPPGTYRAVYRELYLNPIDTRDQPPESVVFTVSAPTPVLRRSWGKLKAIYR